MVFVKLSLAIICFAGQCYPALVGKNTPIGEYKLEERLVIERGYGGDILQFKEDKSGVYAIHRVWLLDPKEHRNRRLHDANPTDRFITHGCINVEPKVYEKLKNCCSYDSLLIEK